MLSEADLLRVWDRGAGESSTERALLLLEVALPEASIESIARWSIGWRDRWLLELRRSIFGEEIAARACCPQCGEPAEFAFPAEAILQLAPPTQPPESLSVTAEGLQCSVRLPNSLDLLALGTEWPSKADDRMLVERCLLGLRHGEDGPSLSEVPPAVLEALEREMSTVDPQCESYLEITCPTCHHQWRALFDVTPFLWAEIDAWARTVLGEVDALARAYGWSESEILQIGPRRRHRYLELVGA